MCGNITFLLNLEIEVLLLLFVWYMFKKAVPKFTDCKFESAPFWNLYASVAHSWLLKALERRNYDGLTSKASLIFQNKAMYEISNNNMDNWQMLF